MNPQKLIGLTEEKALEALKDVGFFGRITFRDGKSLMRTMEFRNNRVNLSIENGLVIGAKIG